MASLIPGPIRRRLSTRKHREYAKKDNKVEIVQNVAEAFPEGPLSSHKVDVNDITAATPALGSDLKPIAAPRLQAEKIVNNDDMPLSMVKEQLIKGPAYSQLEDGPAPVVAQPVVQGPVPFAPVYNATTRQHRSIRSVADGIRYEGWASHRKSVRGEKRLTSIDELGEKSTASEEKPAVSASITDLGLLPDLDVMQLPALDFSDNASLSPVPSQEPAVEKSEIADDHSFTAGDESITKIEKEDPSHAESATKAPKAESESVFKDSQVAEKDPSCLTDRKEPKVGIKPSLTADHKRADSKVNVDLEDVSAASTVTLASEVPLPPSPPLEVKPETATDPEARIDFDTQCYSQGKPLFAPRAAKPKRPEWALIDRVNGIAIPETNPNEPEVRSDYSALITNDLDLSHTQSFLKRCKTIKAKVNPRQRREAKKEREIAEATRIRDEGKKKHLEELYGTDDHEKIAKDMADMEGWGERAFPRMGKGKEKVLE